jgi:nucleotide-binding universal stress UspA family protein
MFKRVIVGVDGRSGGRDAIALAAHLVDPNGRLTLVNVHTGELNPSHAIMPGVVREERDAALKLLHDARENATIDAELATVPAFSPGHGLHVHAERQHADLIVVGSCSRGRLGRILVGDDTRSALNGAPCAIAIATQGYAENPVAFTRIGVAYDGSLESEAALAAARTLADRTQCTVRALKVFAFGQVTYTGLAALGTNLDALLDEAEEQMRAIRDVDGRVVRGFVDEELTAFSQELDILVMGSRGYGPIRRLVFGSTADYLQRHGRCSLLVLPRTAIAEHEVAPAARDGQTAGASAA